MYYNPILYADYSDPDAIRVGEDYYMVASSFTYLPGVPILHSKDLVHWEVINYAVKSLPFEKYAAPSHGSGTWAPSIRYYNDTFFIFIPLPDEGIMVARSKDIYGDFELNMLTQTIGWIDPCPIWREDKAYMAFAYAASRCGKKNVIALIEIDSDARHTIGEEKIIFDGAVIAHTSEGPKAYYKNGYYYILFPSGGVPKGWQSVIRSKDINGPYEYRIAMHQGNMKVNGPHQGAWVEAADGKDWFIHFQDINELGRIIHLQPMAFTPDLWPIIGADLNGDLIGEPVPKWSNPVEKEVFYSIPMTDDFSSPYLSLQWQWQANPDNSNYSLREREGYLRLYTKNNKKRDENLLWYAPNALTEIPQSNEFSLTASLELFAKENGDMVSFGFIGHSYSYIALYYEMGKYFIKCYKGKVLEKTFEGKASEELIYSTEVGHNKVLLRLELRRDMNYLLSYSLDGEKFEKINKIFPLKKSTWTGAKISLWAANRENIESAGYADIGSIM